MSKVQFGLMVPGDTLEKSRRHHYRENVHRLLNMLKGSFHSAWFIDHLQFEDRDVLEGWTALTYLSALHPELQWGVPDADPDRPVRVLPVRTRRVEER